MSGVNQTTIALLEDDPGMRSMLADYLSLQGHRVFEYADPVEFLKAIENPNAGRPDLLITDMVMPRMSGLSLLKTLATERIRLPAIMISANLSNSDRVEVQKLGIRAFLAKPFRLAELSDAVGAALATPCAQVAG